MTINSQLLNLQDAQFLVPKFRMHVGDRPIFNVEYDYLGRIWLIGGDGKLSCYNSRFAEPVATFDDCSFCALYLDGEVGFLGTYDGEIYLLNVSELRLNRLTRTPNNGEIVSIATDSNSERVFFSSVYNIFSVSYDGVLGEQWKCKVQPYKIHFSKYSKLLWSVNDGIEVIDFDHRESFVCGDNNWAITGVAESPTGMMAFFTDEIKIFSTEKELVESIGCISLQFLGGRFVQQRHLVSRATGLNVDDVSRIQLIRWRLGDCVIDVIPNCTCLAISPDSREAIAFLGNELFTFSMITN